MQVNVEQNKPEIILFVDSPEGQFNPHHFLIDTGFQGSCVFIGNNKTLLAEKFLFSDVCELEPEDWIIVADGRRVRTFRAFIFIEFEGLRESLEVRIIQAEQADHPVLGMEFLKQNKKHLSLDFKNEQFYLL